MTISAHLRIEHDIGEQLMASKFTEQQRRILDLILRLSWGCSKESAIIPHQKDFEVVGVREGHIKAHLDWLEEAKVIIRNGAEYTINRDYNKWRVSRATGYTPETFRNLVHINIQNTYVNSKNIEENITENGREKLRKTEESAYGKRNSITHESGSSKEILNKVLNKDNSNIKNYSYVN